MPMLIKEQRGMPNFKAQTHKNTHSTIAGHNKHFKFDSDSKLHPWFKI